MSEDIKAGLDMIETMLGRTNASLRAMLDEGRTIPWEQHANVIKAMVPMLESGLKVALEKIQGKREPYPGASEQVCLQCLDTIDLMRRAGLIPERGAR